VRRYPCRLSLKTKKTRIPGFVGARRPSPVTTAKALVYGTGSKWLDFCMGIAVAIPAIAIQGGQGAQDQMAR